MTHPIYISPNKLQPLIPANLLHNISSAVLIIKTERYKARLPLDVLQFHLTLPGSFPSRPPGGNPTATSNDIPDDEHVLRGWYVLLEGRLHGSLQGESLDKQRNPAPI